MPLHTFLLERVSTPIGRMLVLTDAQARLRAVDWEDYESRMHTLLRRQYGKDAVALRDAGQPSRAGHALQAYFDGDVAAIAHIPVAFGGTPFQQQVWQALRTIPCGETASYQQVAKAIGKPNAVRAVAGACGANKLAIVIPCHRVVRNDGALSGYRWGAARKVLLLKREANNPEE